MWQTLPMYGILLILYLLVLPGASMVTLYSGIKLLTRSIQQPAGDERSRRRYRLVGILVTCLGCAMCFRFIVLNLWYAIETAPAK